MTRVEMIAGAAAITGAMVVGIEISDMVLAKRTELVKEFEHRITTLEDKAQTGEEMDNRFACRLEMVAFCKN